MEAGSTVILKKNKIIDKINNIPILNSEILKKETTYEDEK